VRAPRFWHRDSTSILPAILSPLSVIYETVDQLKRMRKTRASVSIPVICVGNVVAGGAGKTPVAMAIGQFLLNAGWKVHFLSRGYGGNLAGPIRVVLDVHKTSDVGDEPLLLATIAPTWVAKDRVAGAQAAEKAGADVLIMDDGLQNPSLRKDLSLIVIDGGYGLGNGRVIPAGPLREKLPAAVARADALIIIDPVGQSFVNEATGIPVFSAGIVPHALQAEIVGEKVVAFAGIGRPEKFFDSLRGAGADLIEGIEFPDHHVFTQNDIMRLVEKAALHNAALVTTRKDYVRLSVDAKMMTTVFDIDLVFDQPKGLQKMLIDKLGSREHA